MALPQAITNQPNSRCQITLDFTECPVFIRHAATQLIFSPDFISLFTMPLMSKTKKQCQANAAKHTGLSEITELRAYLLWLAEQRAYRGLSRPSKAGFPKFSYDKKAEQNNEHALNF